MKNAVNMINPKKSIDFNILQSIYEEFNLPQPALLPWPLTGKAEEIRKKHESNFKMYLKNNLPPGLKWMEKHANLKYRPDNILPGCRTILLTHLGYYRRDREDEDSFIFNYKGKIARYARGRDYHKELGNRLRKTAKKLQNLFHGEQFKSFTDIGPLDEVWLAVASGAGFRGRHGLAIFPNTGSWAVMGHILTTATITSPSVESSLTACPSECRRCIDACPSHAISMPGILNPGLCYSYHSIEHYGPIDVIYRSQSESWIFGCDICQEACPFNINVYETNVQAFKLNHPGASLDLTELLSIKTREEFVKKLAGTPLMRPGLTGMIRNACTVAGNSGNPDLLPFLLPLTEDHDDGIREHSKWAVKNIIWKMR